jgi:hypothetical protein
LGPGAGAPLSTTRGVLGAPTPTTPGRVPSGSDERSLPSSLEARLRFPKRKMTPGTAEATLNLIEAIEAVVDEDLDDGPYLARQLSVFVTGNNNGMGRQT